MALDKIMKPPLQNHTFLITGAARRIGAALALACGRAGANILLHHHRSDPSETLAQLRALPGIQAHALCSPLDSADDAFALFETAQKILPVTGVINNAARFSSDTLAIPTSRHADAPTGRKLPTPNSSLLTVFGTNTFAPLALMQALHASAPREGLILNLLDQRIAHPAQTPVYTATKSTLAQLTLAAAVEFAPRIRVNAIAPGPVLPPPNVHEKAGPLLLAQRPTLDDLCNAALYLLTAPAVTGQILYVDSGQHLL